MFIENVKFISNNIQIKENMILLEANILSKKFIESIRLKRNNNQSEEFLSKTDFELMSLNKCIEKVKLVYLKLLKTNYRFAIFFRSSL